MTGFTIPAMPSIGGLTGMTAAAPVFQPYSTGTMMSPVGYQGIGDSSMLGREAAGGLAGMGTSAGTEGMQGMFQQMLLTMMMQELMMILMALLAGKSASGDSSGAGLGGSSSSGSGGIGSIGSTGGSGGSSAVDTSSVGASGDDAVALAQKYLGQNAIDIKGKLPHFTAAGGQTNNCADFVSSVLESTGRLKGHFVNVHGLEDALKKQGYRQIPREQAMPGDVWIASDRSHTELVAEKGGTKLIGSNNDRPGHQKISYGSKSDGVFYTKR